MTYAISFQLQNWSLFDPLFLLLLLQVHTHHLPDIDMFLQFHSKSLYLLWLCRATAKDEFRKPQWFEESETDDELFDDDRKFAFQVFTNPMELQKHFERQMQQIMEAVSQFEDGNGGKFKLMQLTLLL